MDPHHVVLATDGADIVVRAIEADDVDRLRRLFYRLSPRTVYLRFFQNVHDPSEEMLRHLAGVDHDRREAVVAIVGDEIVGVARYDRLKDEPARADTAVVVEDAWQGHGIARVLLDELAREAKRHGVEAFTATVLGENRRMLAISKHLNPQAHVHLDRGEWDLELPLTRRVAAAS